MVGSQSLRRPGVGGTREGASLVPKSSEPLVASNSSCMLFLLKYSCTLQDLEQQCQFVQWIDDEWPSRVGDSFTML